MEEKLAQRDTAALTTGEVRHRLVTRRAAKRIHRLLELRVEIPAVRGVDLRLKSAHLGHERIKIRIRLTHELADFVETLDLRVKLAHAFLDVFEDGLLLVQRRLLKENAHAVAGAEARFTVARLVEPRHDLEDGRLTRAVRANHADLGAREEAHGDVVKDDLVAHLLARLVHGVDELCQCLSI